MKNNFDPNIIDKECNSGHGGTWLTMEDENPERSGDVIVAWAAWLDQYQIFLSDRHAWKDVPEIGMQRLVVYYDNGFRQVFTNYDEYTLGGFSEKKLGLMIDFDEYEKICDLSLKLYYDLEKQKFFTRE